MSVQPFKSCNCSLNFKRPSRSAGFADGDSFAHDNIICTTQKKRQPKSIWVGVK